MAHVNPEYPASWFPKHVPAAEHRYLGHRRHSFLQDDVDELVELRARQRTFGGAYVRAALGNFGYALVILKIFSSEFAKIGLIYVILAFLLLIVAWVRGLRSEHDFADIYRPTAQVLAPASTPQQALEPGPRHWGRPFRTSGNAVLLVGAVVSVLYIALFVLVMKL